MRRDHRRRDRVFMATVAAILLVVVAAGATGDATLTTADVVRFLRAGISEGTILAELQARGFGEALDEAREAILREAGASETLVVAVRRAAPAEKAASPRSPAAGSAADGTSFGTPRASAHDATFAASTRTVRIPVSVVDKRGEPVMGLRFDDFRVSDDGKPQPLTLFSGERRALRIALALDLSGSMESKIRQVERALRHFIDLLEPADEIMVITFSDHVRVVQDFTSDRGLLGRVLDMLEPDGATTLFDAAFEAIRRVAGGPAESKAVVLVTDGVDTASATSFDALRELARRSEVPVFSIGLDGGNQLKDFFRPPGPGPVGGPPRRPGGGGRGRWPGGGPGGAPGGWPGGGPPGGSIWRRPAGFDARPLLDLAEETGGRAEIVKGFELEHYTPGSDAPGDSRLKVAVESIAMILRHRYLIGYESPEGKRGWRKIRVDVDRPASSARARKGYYSGG